MKPGRKDAWHRGCMTSNYCFARSGLHELIKDGLKLSSATTHATVGSGGALLRWNMADFHLAKNLDVEHLSIRSLPPLAG